MEGRYISVVFLFLLSFSFKECQSSEEFDIYDPVVKILNKRFSELSSLAKFAVNSFSGLQPGTLNTLSESVIKEIERLTKNKVVQVLLQRLLDVWAEINVSAQRSIVPLKALTDEANNLVEEIEGHNLLVLTKDPVFTNILRKRIEELRTKFRKLIFSPAFRKLSENILKEIMVIDVVGLQEELLKLVTISEIVSHLDEHLSTKQDTLIPASIWIRNLVRWLMEALRLPIHNIKATVYGMVGKIIEDTSQLSKKIQFLSDISSLSQSDGLRGV